MQNAVTITATASDNVGVVSVTIRVDGTVVGAPVTTAPYSVVWDGGSAAPGSHTLTAEAEDAAGNRATSPAVTVTVPPPSPPSNWTGADIGNAPLRGSVSDTDGVWTVHGTGADISGQSDQFFFVYQRVSGDIDVVTRVISEENVDAWTKAGPMIRESLVPDAPHTSIFVTPGNGLAFERRVMAAGASDHTTAGAGAAPVWLKLERRGSAVTAFRSSDGAAWSMVGSETLTLPSAFFVGIAVAVGNTTDWATVTFDNVALQPVTLTPMPPTVTLTAPEDGATFTAPATITIEATASDPDDGVAQVEFFAGTTLLGTDDTAPFNATWPNVAAGTYNLTAVARDQTGATTTSAPHSITVSSPPPPDRTPPTATISSPADGETVEGAITITATAVDSVGVVSVTFRVDGRILGRADTTAPFSATWNTSGVAPGAHTITAEAVDAADNPGWTAVTVNVFAPNQPPTVTLIAPADGAAFTAPASITLDVTASDPDDGVAQVEFFAETTLIGTDAIPPYTATWSDVPPGTYSLTAVVRD